MILILLKLVGCFTLKQAGISDRRIRVLHHIDLLVQVYTTLTARLPEQSTCTRQLNKLLGSTSTLKRKHLVTRKGRKPRGASLTHLPRCLRSSAGCTSVCSRATARGHRGCCPPAPAQSVCRCTSPGAAGCLLHRALSTAGAGSCQPQGVSVFLLQ